MNATIGNLPNRTTSGLKPIKEPDGLVPQVPDPVRPLERSRVEQHPHPPPFPGFLFRKPLPVVLRQVLSVPDLEIAGAQSRRSSSSRRRRHQRPQQPTTVADGDPMQRWRARRRGERGERSPRLRGEGGGRGGEGTVREETKSWRRSHGGKAECDREQGAGGALPGPSDNDFEGLQLLSLSAYLQFGSSDHPKLSDSNFQFRTTSSGREVTGKELDVSRFRRRGERNRTCRLKTK